MNTVTEKAHIALPKAEVFDFLANVENLPLWATAFCESGRWEGDHYKVGTRQGDMLVRIESDSRTGVVDRWTRLDGEEDWQVLPLQIFDEKGGHSSICATCFQSPDQPDEQVVRQCREVRIDLANLSEIMQEKILRF